MNIVLYNPEIPYNTGNIGRSTLAVDATLHLIKPLGFSLDEKAVKRAGLDYWEKVDLKIWDSIEDLYEAYPDGRFFYATTKTTRKYSDVNYKEDDFVIFGPESRGIPESILNENKDTCITIPMGRSGRSLNLSNSVVIVLYEGMRQLGFPFSK